MERSFWAAKQDAGDGDSRAQDRHQRAKRQSAPPGVTSDKPPARSARWRRFHQGPRSIEARRPQRQQQLARRHGERRSRLHVLRGLRRDAEQRADGNAIEQPLRGSKVGARRRPDRTTDGPNPDPDQSRMRPRSSRSIHTRRACSGGSDPSSSPAVTSCARSASQWRTRDHGCGRRAASWIGSPSMASYASQHSSPLRRPASHLARPGRPRSRRTALRAGVPGGSRSIHTRRPSRSSCPSIETGGLDRTGRFRPAPDTDRCARRPARGDRSRRRPDRGAAALRSTCA